MKIFVSWSGGLSHDVALLLRNWLPMILPSAEPWVSSEDIGKGTFWSAELHRQIQVADAGIVCLTRENSVRPWICFEAGALAYRFDRTLCVCPLLVDVAADVLPAALSQFQSSDMTFDGILAFLQTLNHFAQHPKSEDELKTVFESNWPEFERGVRDALRADREKEGDREPARVLQQISQDYMVALNHKNPVFHDAVTNEIAFWASIASQRSHKILDANVEHYNQVLVDLYRTSQESVFSTSLPEYDTTWDSPLGSDIFAAHEESNAKVTRVFVFETRDQVSDRLMAVMERQDRSQKIEVRVYLNQEDKLFTFPTDYSRDFTVIDGGTVIGLTQSYGASNLRAQWHFGNMVMAARLRAAVRGLKMHSKPFQTFRQELYAKHVES